MKLNREQMYDLYKQVYAKLEQKEKLLMITLLLSTKKHPASGVKRQALVAPRRYQ